jgi:hypothetical protein
MSPFIYRCPNTGYRVQGYTANEVAQTDPSEYLTVLCTVCQEIHLLNPATGDSHKRSPEVDAGTKAWKHRHPN